MIPESFLSDRTRRKVRDDSSKWNGRKFDSQQVFDSTERFKVEYLENRLTKYYIQGKNNKETSDIRGDIREFSRKSRRRLKEYLYRLDYKECAFLTLTIPDYYKGYLTQDAYRRILNYYKFRVHSYGFACVIKNEFTVQGMPHLHIFVFDFKYDLFDLKYYMSYHWINSIVRVLGGDYDIIKNMFLACSRIDRVRSDGDLFGYVANYTSSKKGDKEYQNVFPEGWSNQRFYYKWNMGKIPVLHGVITSYSPSFYFRQMKREAQERDLPQPLRQAVFYSK